MTTWVVKTNSRDGWDWREHLQPGDVLDWGYRSVVGGRSIGPEGWRERVRAGDVAWWYDSHTCEVYAVQTLTGRVTGPYDEMSGTLTCIVPRKVRAAATGHRFQSWASLDLPSLAVARMTVVPLNADEGRRWRRLVKTEGGRDG